MKLQKLKHLIRNNPILFNLLWKTRESHDFRRRVVRPNDDIVIEGFPRSGNTFATYAFQNSQNSNLKIGNHFHSPAQFLLARKYEIPAVLLIRKPEDAVVSLAIYHNKKNLEAFLLAYIYFHKPLLTLKDYYVTAKFEEVISDIGSIIHRINHQFNSNFNIVDHSKEFSEEVINLIEISRNHRIKANKDLISSELRKTTPSDKKDQLKVELLKSINSPKHKEQLDIAKDLYYSIIHNYIRTS